MGWLGFRGLLPLIGKSIWGFALALIEPPQVGSAAVELVLQD